MPLINYKTIQQEVEKDIIEKIREHGGSMDTNTLVNHIMETHCCSKPEAIQILRNMQNKGLIKQTGGVWRI